MTPAEAAPARLSVPKAIGGAIAFAVLGAVLMGLLLVGWVAVARPADAGGPGALLAQALTMLAGFGLATWVVGRIALGFGAGELGWQPPARAVPGFGLGFVLGGAAAGLALVAAVALTGAAWTDDAGGAGDWLVQVGRTLLLLAPAALAEEVVFRGLPLVLLAAVLGRPAAVVVLSAAFGAAHLLNPNVTALALANIALAGALLSVVFFAPGGIWSAFGAHLGWNGVLAALDAPVSGLPFAIPWLDYRAGGPVWLTGGNFGPEGGLLATGAIALAIVVAARWAGKERA